MVNLTHRLGPAINCYNVLARDMKHLSFTIHYSLSPKIFPSSAIIYLNLSIIYQSQSLQTFSLTRERTGKWCKPFIN